MANVPVGSWDTLARRVGRARELLAEADGDSFRGLPADRSGFYAALAGALEAQLDLVCESAEAILRRKALRLCRG